MPDKTPKTPAQVTLLFNLPDDAPDLLAVVRAQEMLSLLHEISMEIRGILKHNDPDKFDWRTWAENTRREICETIDRAEV